MKIDAFEHEIFKIKKLLWEIEELKGLIKAADEYVFNIECESWSYKIDGAEIKTRLQEILQGKIKKYEKALEKFNKFELESELEDL